MEQREDPKRRRLPAEPDASPDYGALGALAAALRAACGSDAPDDGGAVALESLLEELLRLKRATANTPAGDEAMATLAELRASLKAAADALQRAVDAHAPPPGSRLPPPGDAAWVGDVLVYAHKLAYTAFAPAGFVPGQTALRHHRPPAPQEPQLRSSALHQAQRDWEAKQAQRGGGAPAAAAAPPPAPPALPAEDLGEVLKQLPPMPAGWKVGDPIPGMAGILAPPPPAAAAAAAATPPAEAPAPAAVQTEPEQPAAAAPPPLRPQVSPAFDIALNPDLDLVFGAGGLSSSESESASG